MKFFCLIFLFGISVSSFAQEKNISFKIRVTFNGQPVALDDNTWYHSNTGDSLQFTSIKCYLSGIGFYLNDKPVYKEKNSFHLFDLENEQTEKFSIKVPGQINCNSLHLQLGIDSATNVSGAEGGDLDPTKGMYWTWQSGYINCKIEGVNNVCKTRGHRFTFHLGGYMPPNCSMQQLSFSLPQEQLRDAQSNTIVIDIALDKFFTNIDLSKQNSIMIPGAEAVDLSKKLANAITIKCN